MYNITADGKSVRPNATNEEAMDPDYIQRDDFQPQIWNAR